MSIWEVEELAAMIIAGNDEAKAEELLNEGDMEGIMYDELEMDFDTFYATVKLLLKYTPVLKSGFTGEHYHAFGVQDGNSFRAIVQEQA